MPILATHTESAVQVRASSSRGKPHHFRLRDVRPRPPGVDRLKAGSPDSRNDRICIKSSCPRLLVLPSRCRPASCRQRQLQFLVYLSPRQSIILSNSAVPLRPLADAMPSSARCPRSALLNIGTLAHQRLSGPVQHQNGLLLRRLLIGTKRIDGRVTASQIAAASFASFLLRLR